MSVPEITPVELSERLKQSTPPRLLDVREPEELAVSKLDGVLEIPLGELAERYRELDAAEEWVVICRSGARSGKATEFLNETGYRAMNMAGGMKAWARDVDPDLSVA